jgi:hypothetical protein
MRRTLIALVIASSLALLATAGVLAQTCSTVVVTNANLSGWSFRLTSPDGAAEFVEPAPATPPLGQGAAYLYTGSDGSASAEIRSGSYGGTLLSSITSLKYCTYVQQWNGGQAPYIILRVDTDGNGTTDDLLFFEPEYSNGGYNGSIPAQPAIQLNTWQCWDALAGGWYSVSGFNGSGPGTNVQSWSDLVAAYPAGSKVAAGTSGIRILVGFASPTDVYESYVDAATIGVGGNCITYDFEEFTEPASAEQCKKGGWQTFSPARPAGPFKNQGDCIQSFNTGK